jgi:pimeloyl-ACP methyl ester carboxylesterase
MKRFASFDGVEIAYQEWGPVDGSPPVVLHHGFVADANANWVNPGIVGALVSAGRRVVGIDARGHGASDKPYDPKCYGTTTMSRDLSLLFDLIGAAQVDLVGYSLGGLVAIITATRDQRVRRLVVGGIGSSVVEQHGLDGRAVSGELVIAALLTDDPTRITDPHVAGFRVLADVLGADRQALAAVLSAPRPTDSRPLPLAGITACALVLVGRDDALATRPEVLAAAIPGARLQLVEGDHLTALRDPTYAPTLVGFLSEDLIGAGPVVAAHPGTAAVPEPA